MAPWAVADQLSPYYTSAPPISRRRAPVAPLHDPIAWRLQVRRARGIFFRKIDVVEGLAKPYLRLFSLATLSLPPEVAFWQPDDRILVPQLFSTGGNFARVGFYSRARRAELTAAGR
jgi:hypothetical protein